MLIINRLIALLVLIFSTQTWAAELTPIRVGVLQFGTVNWELDVIRHHRLAEQQAVDLQVVPLGSKNALSVALQGGAADVIVTDWIWVSRQRAANRNYTFFPYSRAVGALFVRPDSGIKSLSDLNGKSIGIAGGPVDKSWLLLRAYARRKLDLDLHKVATPTFAAPPLLNELMLKGDLPAVLNFWNYGARLKAAGMTQLTTVIDLVRELGIESEVPLLGWVFSEAWAQQHKQPLLGFLKASYAAKQILADSDGEWVRIRSLTRASDDTTLSALRDSYRAGIPTMFGDVELQAAARVFEILALEGGEELVGQSGQLSPGTFWQVTSPQALMQ